MSPKKEEQEFSKKEIEKLTEALSEYQAIYEPYFKRKEQKSKAKEYMKGLIQPLPNKSIEKIVLHNEGAEENEIRAMQHFMSEGSWEDEPILKRHRQEVDKELGSEEGVMIVDGSGFPKQGEASVGVKRQWCGQVGKVANCQVGVFMGYVSQSGYTLLDRRLYLPKEWVDDEAYAIKRKKCGVPDDVSFKTKPELAVEMIQAVAQSGDLRYKWLTCDEAFGRDGAFLDQVATVAWYFAEVPQDTQVWLKRPQIAIPDYKGKGRKPIHPQLLDGQPNAQSISQLAADLTPQSWSRHTIKLGSKGPIVADFAALRVVNSRHGLPDQDVWLICRRDLGTQEIKFYLSNAPQLTPLDDFVRVSGLRWPIETGFEDCKQALGMGDYQLRGWLGWHHHMTLVILAHFFLLKSRNQLQSQGLSLTLPQAILLLQAVLPQPKFDLDTTFHIVQYYQRRHHQAFLSHSKRRRLQLQLLE